MKPDRVSANLLRWLHWAPLVAVLAALPSQAQYKVIGADGKITYTDRPPATSQGKITALGVRGAAVGADAALPLELRQPVARYPVTLYNIAGACDPCESARQMLRQRGIPFNEKQAQSAEDGEALERLTGSRDAPTLMIGAQSLRGWAPEVWGSYLDAAGYPRESRLPANYQFAPATPIIERREASAARVPAARIAAPPAAEAPAPANPAGIKF